MADKRALLTMGVSAAAVTLMLGVVFALQHRQDQDAEALVQVASALSIPSHWEPVDDLAVVVPSSDEGCEGCSGLSASWRTSGSGVSEVEELMPDAPWETDRRLPRTESAGSSVTDVCEVSADLDGFEVKAVVESRFSPEHSHSLVSLTVMRED